MTTLFSSPKIPKTTATNVPAITDTTQAEQDAQDRLQRRKGVTATVSAGDSATVSPGSVATKALLGS
ncbi:MULTISPECIES: hypothetical protein [unclassified Caballeronia]|uniref:hypothetical protein n=1 Tax=unclassified Caballeronia TaxID=2646786 RepID=UPI001F24F1BC|nr:MULTISPECIES: hypothetical protein [unclassified Caballeronia]MCE4544603.1 hypothetical protein [Caballeronia sp. PC1]MCE4571755.1 hypothetical protein [Caballeronia sp. CLC5]